MVRPRHLARMIAIHRVVMRHRLYEIPNIKRLLGPARWLLYLWPGTWQSRSTQPISVRLRLTLEDLGPVFIKFGQALSTRPDLLSPDFAKELSKLQDKVPPFDGEVARDILHKAFGKPPTEVFSDFEVEPLASASIAQVHAARLTDTKAGIDNREVVIKVLRPGVEKTISRDVDMLTLLARLAHRYWPESRRLRPIEVVEEYKKTIFDELDLMREAANGGQLRRNFENLSILYIPEMFWDYCRTNVVVMERIRGIPVSDIAALKERKVNMAVLAERGVEIFFTQVFNHNFFHADMHPGNIFINAEDPEDPRYIAVDFGIVGTLTARDQHYLAGNLLAFFKRDYKRVAELHLESGWVPPGTRIDEFETAIRTVSEPVFNKPLKDISFGHYLLRLFQVARRFNMEVQPQLVLLQKTLLNIEGLGRQLYPDLDLWTTAKPFMEDWMREQVSGKEMLNRLRDNLPEMGESLRDMPQLMIGALQHLAEGKVTMNMTSPSVDRLREENRVAQKQAWKSTGGGALVIAGALLVGLGAQPVLLGWGTAGAGILLWWTSRPPED
ncbi:MAG: ubiquinone biosynthesis regulatory protein kinase UbiB [Pseudomonadota bacterium]